MKKIIFGLILFFSILLIGSFSFPESFAQNDLGRCAPLSLEYNFNYSDVVFYGIPITKEPIDDTRTKIQIDVLEVYKGNISKGINTIHTAKIQHYTEGTLYGDPFHEFEKGYVVYATNENGELWTRSAPCSISLSFRADLSERFEFLPDFISPLTSSELSTDWLDEHESRLWWSKNFWNVVLSLSVAIMVTSIIITVIKKKNHEDSK